MGQQNPRRLAGYQRDRTLSSVGHGLSFLTVAVGQGRGGLTKKGVGVDVKRKSDICRPIGRSSAGWTCRWRRNGVSMPGEEGQFDDTEG